MWPAQARRSGWRPGAGPSRHASCPIWSWHLALRHRLLTPRVLTNDFDIFCSYAHGDDDDGWVEQFVAALTSTFRRLTGEPPRVFLDRESIITAEVWEQRIRAALDGSQVAIAVVSPSFVRSEWCRREWDEFMVRESDLRKQGLLADEQGLVFPVLLYPLGRGRFDAQQAVFSSTIKERQWLDVSSRITGTPVRPDQVLQLAEQIIDTLAELQHRRRVQTSAAESAASGLTIRDPDSGVEWSAALSPRALRFDEALKYVEGLALDGVGGWRLPTKSELESLIDPSAVVDDPKASPFPLRDPFNAQRSGYLHSGTEIGAPGDGNFVMNIRNGHIFNGKGLDCYVRAVRNLD